MTDLQEQKKENPDQNGKESPPKIEALFKLHVRACRTSSEVLCLLRSGHADGAIARWRTLHEIATLSIFLSGNVDDTAARYLKHATIERFKAAHQFQSHNVRLGYDPIENEEFLELGRERKEVIAQYGDDFASEYGWAAKAIGKKKPTFADIEKSIKLAHWRPHFKMACNSVHAGSQGLSFSLASPSGGTYAGATIYGLTDPAHCSALSLTFASTAFLTCEPNLDALVNCRIMSLLSDDIGEAFLRAHKKLETNAMLKTSKIRK